MKIKGSYITTIELEVVVDYGLIIESTTRDHPGGEELEYTVKYGEKYISLKSDSYEEAQIQDECREDARERD